MVWTEFVTTSIILVTTSKKCGYRRHGGRAAMLKGPRENTGISHKLLQIEQPDAAINSEYEFLLTILYFVA